MTLLVENKPFNALTTDITANILDLNDGPHTFIWKGHKQVLNIENNEAVPLTITVLGQGELTTPTPGLGVVTLADVGNNSIVIATGATATINVDIINSYMGDTGNTVDITITGSTAPALAYVWLNEFS